jgi:hypothetical protein
MRLALVLLAMLLLVSACRRPGGIPLLSQPEDAQPAFAHDLDGLAEDAGPVSVSGVVLEQHDEGRLLLVDDGTGLVFVRLPEPTPMIAGLYLSAWGPVERDGERFTVRATEWLYDSTAVPVRSD